MAHSGSRINVIRVDVCIIMRFKWLNTETSVDLMFFAQLAAHSVPRFCFILHDKCLITQNTLMPGGNSGWMWWARMAVNTGSLWTWVEWSLNRLCLWFACSHLILQLHPSLFESDQSRMPEGQHQPNTPSVSVLHSAPRFGCVWLAAEDCPDLKAYIHRMTHTNMLTKDSLPTSGAGLQGPFYSLRFIYQDEPFLSVAQLTGLWVDVYWSYFRKQLLQTLSLLMNSEFPVLL